MAELATDNYSDSIGWTENTNSRKRQEDHPISEEENIEFAARKAARRIYSAMDDRNISECIGILSKYKSKVVSDEGIFKEQFSNIEKRYSLRDPSAIFSFLIKNQFLFDLLKDAPTRINSFFPNSDLVLELIVDPEGDTKVLFIYIQTGVQPAEALTAISKLDKQWWLKASSEASGKVCVDVEFK